MRSNQKDWKTSAHSWLAGVLSSALLALTACGPAEEAPAAEVPVRADDARPADADGAVRPETGRGHGCPTESHECRAYCVSHGASGGHCSGYGRSNCVCLTKQ